MPKYMIHGKYVGEGLKGLIKDGGSKRRDIVTQLLEGMGGKMEAFYFAFGDDDVFAIVDVPDNASAAAIAMAVNASGAVTIKTTVLMTPEEVDQATKKTVNYRPPGA